MQVYIKELKIEDVRGIKDIDIPVSGQELRHLILTGKNGSGKTSVLNAIQSYLKGLTTDKVVGVGANKFLRMEGHDYNAESEAMKEMRAIMEQEEIRKVEEIIHGYKQGIDLQLNLDLASVYSKFNNGDFIVAYYKADRVFNVNISDHIQKVKLKESYEISDYPREEFAKFLADLKATAAFTTSEEESEKEEINRWFLDFEKMLKEIFDEQSLRLVFEKETFSFKIDIEGKPRFDFNQLSSGYAAVLDIIVDLILRMQNKSKRRFVFDSPGIVLIDEIETHLHLELQKTIFEFLTATFPNIQFIVTTHSPFILNSLGKVTIYDLENKIFVKDGLENVSYEGVVEGYFKVDKLSNKMKDRFERYKELVLKAELQDKDFLELSELEMVLDEVPDFLELEFTTEYERLKLEFNKREDL